MSTAAYFIVSAQTLRHLDTCERHAWLDQHGDKARRDFSPDAAPQFVQGIRHEQIVQQATAEVIESIPVASWDDGLQATFRLMQLGVPLILNAYLEKLVYLDDPPVRFLARGKVDRLVRGDWSGRPLYAPVEIKQRTEVEESDLLQLDFYAWLLALIQGEPVPAWFWLGRDESGFPLEEREHAFDEPRLHYALNRAFDLLRDKTEPPVSLKSACDGCPWHVFCRDAAERLHDVSLIPRLRRDTVEELRRAGISTYDHVAALDAGDLQRFKGIGKATAPQIHASARAWATHSPVWIGSLPPPCREPGSAFDLETCMSPEGGVAVWSLGWCDSQGAPHAVLVAPDAVTGSLTLNDGQTVTLAPSGEEAWRVFAEAVAANGGPVYHWTAYDARTLELTAPPDVLDVLHDRMHDLHATFNAVVRLPTRGASIKEVARYFRYSWPGYTDAFAAYADYLAWLSTGDLGPLTRACAYQRGDVESLDIIWRWLAQNAPG